MNYIPDHAGRIAALCGEHLGLVAGALAVALAVAVPIAVLAVRKRRVGGTVLAVLGAIYTIPSLALLAVLVTWFGLGPLPIFVALVAYAQFMLVRNFVAGLQGVDPGAVDAARGIGLTNAQRLIRVEIPLALPVALGGIRVAAVAMIAIATLGGYVGAGGLGTLIFDGLTLHHNDMIVAGGVMVCALAIAVDAALRAVEAAARRATA